MRAEIRVRVSKSGEAVMERYIHDENLRLFRKQLAEATHEKQRQLLRDLIAEEEIKDPVYGQTASVFRYRGGTSQRPSSVPVAFSRLWRFTNRTVMSENGFRRRST
jgi:hypothetical protein